MFDYMLWVRMANNMLYAGSGGFFVHGITYGQWGEGIIYLGLSVVVALMSLVVAWGLYVSES